LLLKANGQTSYCFAVVVTAAILGLTTTNRFIELDQSRKTRVDDVIALKPQKWRK